MNNLNYCLKCTGTIKPAKTYKLLPKSLLKIHQMNKTMNPKLQKLIDQLINKKYD